MDVDLHLTIDSVKGGNIKGEAENDAISIQNFSLGVSLPRDKGGGQATGRRVYSDVTIYKFVDRSTPNLMTMIATNTQIKKAKITAKKQGSKQEVFYTVELFEGSISNYENLGYVSGNSQNSGFVSTQHAIGEKITINFSRIIVEYFKQEPDGSMKSTGTFVDDVRPGV